MRVRTFLYKLTKLSGEPTKYDNKTSHWCKWVNGAWLVDCCRSIKGILWGFDFIKTAPHGGAVCGRGYPDYTTEQMINHCYDVSSDMSPENILPGELLWMKNHVGVYLGNRVVFEACPSKGGAAATDLSYQNWKKHGKLKVIDYSDVIPTPAPAPVPDHEPYEGEKLTLKNEPLYSSSKKTEPANQVTGHYYVTDGKLYNGRIRICSKPEYIGQVDKVLGWIDWRC